MNKDILDGQWLQLKGEMRKAWGDLTESDLDKTHGRYDQVIGLVQERYGKSKDEATKAVDKVIDRYDDLEWKGGWNQLKGHAQETWGKLTDDDLEQVRGRQTRLAGALQERYGHSREEAWKEVREFLNRV